MIAHGGVIGWGRVELRERSLAPGGRTRRKRSLAPGGSQEEARRKEEGGKEDLGTVSEDPAVFLCTGAIFPAIVHN